jgi:hypothetical protein
MNIYEVGQVELQATEHTNSGSYIELPHKFAENYTYMG